MPTYPSRLERMAANPPRIEAVPSPEEDRIQALKDDVRSILSQFLGSAPTPELVDKVVETAISAAKK
ncbi:hypothetical protein IQ249_24680 [Lusitaniella coriacea LEGE 07157]|uniref:Uncharacterized protein n=1 Tax=Lusitaniella coriacea LEGE 07157 TaxID=945747 RepID=A0A8J7E1S6_9CYAN|nr:hypothetical protein [Lusitaniella coriacea]MBE9119056.1 hypothetical protein [Lusitaniella coriacea LEGE 07157]